MVRHHKLFWGSSYDTIVIGHNICYNKYYDNNNMRLVQDRVSNSQSVVQESKKSFLFQRLQVSMEQDSCGLLEGQTNTLLCTSQPRCKEREEWQMEGWQTNRQIGLYSNSPTRTSSRRRRWLCKRASLNNRTENRQIFTKRGGSPSC